jgi:hypothetical protein
MSLPTLRSLAHFMLAMTVALGLATQGVRASGMAAKASKHTEAIADMAMVGTTATPMCDKCDGCKNGGCKGDRCISSGACAACCCSLPALPAVGALLPIPLCEAPTQTSETSGSGWANPPDPHPPRTIILS